jgi:hypothetical protein
MTEKQPFLVAVLFSGNMDFRRFTAPVLDRVSDQILKELHEHDLSGQDVWQRTVGHGSPAGANGLMQIQQGLFQNIVTVNGNICLFPVFAGLPLLPHTL